MSFTIWLEESNLGSFVGGDTLIKKYLRGKGLKK